LTEIRRLGYVAVGRKYRVSDNAIRKWVRQYERERALEEGRHPSTAEIPTRTWPNQLQGAETA
jgi:transposase-like protein